MIGSINGLARTAPRVRFKSQTKPLGKRMFRYYFGLALIAGGLTTLIVSLLQK